MASCGYFDEDRTAKVKEEWSPRRGIVSTYSARRDSIMEVQSFFSELDSPDTSL